MLLAAVLGVEPADIFTPLAERALNDDAPEGQTGREVTTSAVMGGEGHAA